MTQQGVERSFSSTINLYLKLFLFNSTSDTHQFCMPRAVQQLSWNLFINTNLVSPDDIYPDADGPELPETIGLREKSLVVFVG